MPDADAELDVQPGAGPSAGEPSGRDRPPVSPSRIMFRVLAVLALLGLVAGTAVRAFGLSGGLLAAVVGLTPFIGLAYLLPILLGALGRSRLLAALGVAGLLVHLVWAAPLFVPDQAKGDRALTVLSANLEYGGGDPATIVRLVREHDVDVVSLQELTDEAMPGIRAAGLDRLLPYRYAVPGPPTPAGSGIWSRYPLSGGVKLEPTRFHNLRATVDIGQQRLTVVAAHPFPPVGPDGHRLWTRDFGTLQAALADVDGPAIVAGDFNATPDHRPLRKLYDLGYVDAADSAGSGVVATWPAGSRIPPVLALDHVLVKGEIGVEHFERVRVPGTDHYAVLAELRL
ncbi:endonuclease/exonuclease/phosphatase family protein [Flindersiella endophytica]